MYKRSTPIEREKRIAVDVPVEFHELILLVSRATGKPIRCIGLEAIQSYLESDDVRRSVAEYLARVQKVA